MLPLLVELARADAPVLATDRLAVALAGDGSLVAEDLGLGLLWDPDGAGPVPCGGDWLLAGYPFEGWSLSAGDVLLGNSAPYGGSAFAVLWDEPEDNGWFVRAHGVADEWPVAVEIDVSVPWDEDLVWIDLRFHAETALDDVVVSRAVDPDPDFEWAGTYVTRTAVGEGWAGAASEERALALGLAGRGGRGALTGFQLDPAAFTYGEMAEASGDYQIGAAVEVGDVEAGSSFSVGFAYAFFTEAGVAGEIAAAAAEETDRDGDRVEDADDCDAYDPTVGAGLPEAPDGLDNDCDGQVDEGTAVADDDGDGWTEADGDCDDADAAVHPQAGDEAADCDGYVPFADDAPPADDGDDGIEVEGGCACASDAAGASPPALALVALAFARRARRPR